MNARKWWAQERAKEVEMSRKQLGLEKEDNLKAVIQSRQRKQEKEMDNIQAQMEAKYCKMRSGEKKHFSIKKRSNGVLAGMAQWLEHQPVN